jgi:hypothetical protein
VKGKEGPLAEPGTTSEKHSILANASDSGSIPKYGSINVDLGNLHLQGGEADQGFDHNQDQNKDRDKQTSEEQKVRCATRSSVWRTDDRARRKATSSTAARTIREVATS